MEGRSSFSMAKDEALKNQDNVSMKSIHPLKTRFYIVTLRYTGVHIFLFLLQNIDYVYSLEPSHNIKNIIFVK